MFSTILRFILLMVFIDYSVELECFEEEWEGGQVRQRTRERKCRKSDMVCMAAIAGTTAHDSIHIAKV